MQQQSNYEGWDFTNTWVNYDGYTSPLLREFLTPLTVTANDTIKDYDGVAALATGVRYSRAPNADLLGTFNWGGETDVGSYAPSGLYSHQQGYLITYVGGTLTVNPGSTATPAEPTTPTMPTTPTAPTTPTPTPTTPTTPVAAPSTPAAPAPLHHGLNNILVSLTNPTPSVPGPSTTITVQQINSAATNTSPDGQLVVAITAGTGDDPTLAVSGPGPTLRIVDGGVKLPSTMINIQQ